MIDGLSPISLEETVALADLQTRVDRKYIVPPAVADEMAATVDGLRVLEISGSRQFSYQSDYFDTTDLASFYGAALGRRRRFKVRTRTYLDASETHLEVKTRGGRNQTVKQRLPILHSHSLSDRSLEFVFDLTGQRDLGETLRSRYQRQTLVDVERPYRVAVDHAVTALDLRTGRSATLEPFLVVETKSDGAATPVDRWLWQEGFRPVRFSKYCTGLAVLDRSLPSNKWHRTIRTYWPSSDA